jgi:hypothetical protein
MTKHTPGLWTGRVLSGGLRPFCQVCNWRKGGPDSWDGRACKCGLTKPPMADTAMVIDIWEGAKDAANRAAGDKS